METIKSYTDIEQSKRLAEFLPLDTVWNEEDEINYNYALAACIYYGEAKGYADTETHQKTIDWLKSLKGRVHPQNWKPSDEQIKVCKEVYADVLSAKGFDVGTKNSELNRLEEQLKNL